MKTTTKRIVAIQVLMIVLLICVIWLDEWIDLPYLLLNAAPTPVNYEECFFETFLIIVLCSPLIFYNYRVLTKIDNIVALLPVCSVCHKICDKKDFWNALENCAKQYGDIYFTNGVCLECLEKYHPEMYQKKISEMKKV